MTNIFQFVENVTYNIPKKSIMDCQVDSSFYVLIILCQIASINND